MTRKELISTVSDDITISGQMELNVPEKEINRIIDQEERVAYKTWRDTVEVQYAVMNPAAFNTEEFRGSRSVQLPKCVWGINMFKEIKDGSRFFGINDMDLTMDKVFGSDLFLSPFSSDIITTRTVTWSWFDLAKTFTLTDIGFKFNQNSHRITVTGRTPRFPVVLQAYVGIPEQELFEDYYFQRLVIARSKMQLHRMLKTFDYQVVGGVQIINTLMDEGKSEYDSIMETKQKQDPADWFIMSP